MGLRAPTGTFLRHAGTFYKISGLRRDCRVPRISLRQRPALQCERYKTPNARTRSKPRQQTQAVRQASKRRQFSQLAEQRRHLPAIVYVVQKGDIHKVGISSTAAKTDRVREHEINGWTLRQQWTVPTYDEARAIELKVLRYWRKQLQLRPVKIDMPQGGQTETADLHRTGYESTRVLLARETSRAQLRDHSTVSHSTKHIRGPSRVRAFDQTRTQSTHSVLSSGGHTIHGRFVKLNHSHSAQIQVKGRELTLESQRPIRIAGPGIKVTAVGAQISPSVFFASEVTFKLERNADQKAETNRAPSF